MRQQERLQEQSQIVCEKLCLRAQKKLWFKLNNYQRTTNLLIDYK